MTKGTSNGLKLSKSQSDRDQELDATAEALRYLDLIGVHKTWTTKLKRCMSIEG
jgi:hypothetical protein